MRTIKSTRVYLFLILFINININCKNINNKNSETGLAKVDTLIIESKGTASLKSNAEEIKIESNSYFFNKVFKKQMFTLNIEKSDLEKEFKNKKIDVDKNVLYFSDCSTEIRIKNDKTKNHLNGVQNIEIYNDILSESNFKLGDDIKYIVPLYPDNKCDLPSDNFILLDTNNILFVYKGYLILFSKSLNFEPKIDVNQKIICEDQKGNMEYGFVTNCYINENLKEAYKIFITESQINEIKYLKKDLPLQDTKYTIKEAEVYYKNKENTLRIELLFPGGETFITFTSKNNKTEIKVENFPQ
jgi:rRNA-processing protein FCF1